MPPKPFGCGAGMTWQKARPADAAVGLVHEPSRTGRATRVRTTAHRDRVLQHGLIDPASLSRFAAGRHIHRDANVAFCLIQSWPCHCDVTRR